MAENYEERISLTVRTWKFKETIKNTRKKLETPMAPAMPFKESKNNKNCGSGASNKNQIKTCVCSRS